jgi:hypothetical protein
MSVLKSKNPHETKISATFLAFVSPSLEVMGMPPGERERDALLKLCWGVWNAVVYADFVGTTDFLDQMLDPSRSSPAGVVMVKALVERKRSRRFANDDRLIGDYKVRDVDGESRLWAEARSPYPADRTGKTSAG